MTDAARTIGCRHDLRESGHRSEADGCGSGADGQWLTTDDHCTVAYDRDTEADGRPA